MVEVKDPNSLVDDKIDAKVVAEMFERGVRTLTGKDMKASFGLFFEPGDVIGIKVNPVGPPLINTHVELTQAVVAWLHRQQGPAGSHRHLGPLRLHAEGRRLHAGQFPKGVRIEGLQTMDETGNTWKDASGNHVSIDNFDKDVFYFAKGIVGKGVKGYKDDEFYLNQHVYNGEYSYFGKLVTKQLTKIINLAAFKNTGAGISMATKNMGYGVALQHGPAARAAVLQRLHGGARGAGRPR